MASNKGLGKGLGALLGESAMQPVNQQSPLLLPLQKIEPNRLQPRRNFDEEELSALADSIRQHGVADGPASGFRVLSDHCRRTALACSKARGLTRGARRRH